MTNDNTRLSPRTELDGPTLEFDFPGLEVGVAEYDEGPTGCTVFHIAEGAFTAIDVRGGYPGLYGGNDRNHAICLAGGSLYGLEACTGVQAELGARRDFSSEWTAFPLVSGAICYDFGARDNGIYPDKELGRAALRAAVEGRFPIGPRGAGRSATVGNGFDFTDAEPAGQGAACRTIAGTRVAVFTVVNALGAIVDRRGNVVLGHRPPDGGERYHAADNLERRIAAGKGTRPPGGNTTMTVVVTEQRLSRMELQQLARQTHSSMARAIQPFHALEDGDVLFALTTNRVENDRLSATALGVIASELAWDAVLSVAGGGAG